MELFDFLLAIILIGGLGVCFLGINIYRYAVIIMSGAGGFMVGRMFCNMFLNNFEGEGVLRDSSTSAMDSFVIAVCVIGGCALGFFLYNAMGIIVATIGGGFMFAKGLQAIGGADMTNLLVGALIGVLIGAGLGILAVKFNKFPMVLFTALCGARITGYCGASFLADSEIAPTLAKPLLGIFSEAPAEDAVRMAIFLELFVILTILGIVIQSFIRED